ncbi:MAG: iron-sulfur cluster repair di-iron protein [Niabella sp.]
MSDLLNKTIGEIVAKDFRTAAIFTSNKMDFCCGGHKTVKEVCEKKNVDEAALIANLEAVLRTKPENQIDFLSWPLDLLSDYIVKTHHRYVTEKIPVIQQYLTKLCRVHGERHPELLEVNQLFSECAEALTAHLQKEENILFPFIAEMVEAKIQGGKPENPHFGTVDNPINMMVHEHEAEGERLIKIATLTNEYNPPVDACNTYRVAFAMLKDFEQNLHVHVHLENNILFPKAIEMEKSFSEPVLN